MLINNKKEGVFLFRFLEKEDVVMLGKFFYSLSSTTKAKFGPHPLTREYAALILYHRVGLDNTLRYIITSFNTVIGYFIIDFNKRRDKFKRY